MLKVATDTVANKWYILMLVSFVDLLHINGIERVCRPVLMSGHPWNDEPANSDFCNVTNYVAVDNQIYNSHVLTSLRKKSECYYP
jgi:hypothetical protein